MMKAWVCKTALSGPEVIRSQTRPAKAVCEAPVRPDGNLVDRIELVILKWAYNIPGTQTRVEVADEHALPPMYYRNPVTHEWITPVPDPVPRFWFRNGEWFETETIDAESHPAARQVPPVYAFAELDQAAYAEALEGQIRAVRESRLAHIRAMYEFALSSVRGQYSQAEREAWPQKELEAKEWNSLSASDKSTAINSAMSLIVEEALAGDYSGTIAAKKAKVDAVAARVIANSAAYRVFSGKCTGIMKKAIAEVNAMTGTVEELNAQYAAQQIDWPVLGG